MEQAELKGFQDRDKAVKIVYEDGKNRRVNSSGNKVQSSLDKHLLNSQNSILIKSYRSEICHSRTDEDTRFANKWVSQLPLGLCALGFAFISWLMLRDKFLPDM